MLLQIVPLPRNIAGHLKPVGKAYASHLSQRRIRFLRRHRLDLKANPSSLWTAIEDRSLALYPKPGRLHNKKDVYGEEAYAEMIGQASDKPIGGAEV